MYSIRPLIRGVFPVLLAAAATASAGFAQMQKNYRFTAGPGASVSVLNEFGRVDVKPSSNAHINATAVLNSDKATVEATQKGNRVELRTRLLGRPQGRDAKVDYVVYVPANATVTIRSADGPLQVEGLEGDVTVEGEAASVNIVNAQNAHVHVRTVGGPITITNVKNAYVEAASVSGSIDLNDVSGPKIMASTGNGKLRFAGDCTGGGTYTLVNHAGDTEVVLPTSASVDVSARSLKGRVLNEFPFQANDESSPNRSVDSAKANSLTSGDGKAFTGTSNSGASSIRVNSFSGTITVRKQ